MAAETKGPERIWLQDDGDYDAAIGPDLTWCANRINDGDTGYVRADLHDALRARYEEAMEALRSAEFMISALRLAFDRGDARYQECVDAAAKYRALIERHREDGDAGRRTANPSPPETPTMRIYKYPLAVADEQTIALPEGAQILTVQEQYGEPMLWALVDPDADTERRMVRIYGTGYEVDRSDLRYVSTFQMHGGALVFHVFIGPGDTDHE